MFEDLLIPASAEAFAADVLFDRGVQWENVKGHGANGGRDLGGGALANAAGLFGEGHVQNVMLAVLDRPVATDVPGEGADLGAWLLMK